MTVRSIVLYLGAAVILAGFGAAPAASDDDVPPEGVVVLTNGPAHHEGELQWFECANEPQLALAVVDVPGCGDYGGDHSFDHYYFMFGFRINETGNAGSWPLTGALEATLYWADDEIVLRCHWDSGHFDHCDIPLIPPLNHVQTFGFRCESVLGTVGHWGDCFMAHS